MSERGTKVILDLEPEDYLDGALLALSVQEYFSTHPDANLIGRRYGGKWFSVERNKNSITVRRSS